MNTSEVLDRAADLIEERGWHQGGAGWGGDGSLCVINACSQVDRRMGAWLDATDRVMDYLGINGGLAGWNDAPGRTQAEVVGVLRAAAVVEAARETAVVEVTA